MRRGGRLARRPPPSRRHGHSGDRELLRIIGGAEEMRRRRRPAYWNRWLLPKYLFLLAGIDLKDLQEWDDAANHFESSVREVSLLKKERGAGRQGIVS